jgi:quercetin dioxygenase-like cupin family protein
MRTRDDAERRETMELLRPSAAYLPKSGGRTLWTPWGAVTYKVSAGQTGGAYSLFEWTVRPKEGMPPHIEHREDECLYVIEGEFEFLKEEEAIRAGAGTLIYFPKGIVHAFENSGAEPGCLLDLFTPGGAHERFFEEVGEEARSREKPPGIENLPSIAARYGIEVLSPVR